MISYKHAFSADDTLYHDGQKGMRWGIRKYRNYDGTLTAAGRERYGVGPAKGSGDSSSKRKLSRAERKAQKEIKRKASAKEAERKAKEMIEEAKRASEEAKKEREALEKAKKDADNAPATKEENDQTRLENERIKMKIERMKLDREYSSLVNPVKQKKTLIAKAGEFADNARKVLAFGKDVAELGAAIKKAEGGGGDPNSKLKEKAEAHKLQYEIDMRDYRRKNNFKP